MKNRFSEEEKAEALSRATDEMNAGKTPDLEKMGELGREIAPLVKTAQLVRKHIGVLKPLSEEKMAEGFASVRKRFEELVLKQALAEEPESSRVKLNLDRRSDFLLLLLHYAKEIWGNVKLVKLLFLLWNEGESVKGSGDFYGHYAYNYGAFDEDIPKDLKVLGELGAVEKKNPPRTEKETKQVEAVYQLTNKGERVTLEIIESARKKNPGVLRDIQEIIRKYGNMNTPELLSYTYKKYPKYAKKSKVKDQYSD